MNKQYKNDNILLFDYEIYLELNYTKGMVLALAYQNPLVSIQADIAVITNQKLIEMIAVITENQTMSITI